MRHNLIYIGSTSGTINIRDIRAGIEIIARINAHKSKVSCLITSKHNTHVFYSAGADGIINAYDLRNLEQSYNTDQPQQKYGITCLYEANNGKIYSGGAEGLRIWDNIHNKSCMIRSACALINGEIKKVSLQYVDCISANDDESELYISNIPIGITVLSPKYGIEEFGEDIAQLSQS